MRHLGGLRYFAWVPVLVLLIGLGIVATRLQFIFAYEYTGAGHGYAGLQGRDYRRCTYIGLTGVTTVPAEAGRCGWLRLAFDGRR